MSDNTYHSHFLNQQYSAHNFDGQQMISRKPQDHLPKFLAPENVHQKLEDLGQWHLLFSNFTHFSTASSYSHKEKQPKKTIFIKTTTTKPPIVWFPGDPDCGEGDLGGSMSMLLKYVERFVMFSFQDHLKKMKGVGWRFHIYQRLIKSNLKLCLAGWFCIFLYQIMIICGARSQKLKNIYRKCLFHCHL